jgi:hypothetical protein
MNTTIQGWMARARLITVLAGSVVLAGCAGDGTGKTGDAGIEVLAGDRTTMQREAALSTLVKETASGDRDAKQTRDTLKQLVWKTSAPEDLRVNALKQLLGEPGQAMDPEIDKDNRNLLRLRLPTETSWKMIEVIARAAETGVARDPAWKELTASLVRSYARKVPAPTDDARPERRALAALHPERDVESTVLDVYVRPIENGAPMGVGEFVEKSRQAAWELLARLDPSGSRRQAALAGGAAANEPSLALVDRAARELAVVPITGSELAWIERLSGQTQATWWEAARAAVSGLSAEQRASLSVRHLEPLRWAAAHRSAWTAMSRGQLLSELSRRLEGRRVYRKTDGLAETEGKSREALSERADELAWGDVLTLLVVDEALSSASVQGEFWKQAAADRADVTTEYGGALLSADQADNRGAVGGPGFVVRGFVPRPAQRVNDRTFIGSEELFAQSARGVAHYHFHVQDDRNAGYAGPGKADMEYASTHGRTCLVLTSVSPGVMNVDWYARGPGGVVTVDLGELRQGR